MSPKEEVKAAPALPVEAPATKAEKFKVLNQLSKQLDKKFSTADNKVVNTLVRLGAKVGIPIPSIATGLPTVDYELIGTGGVPDNRIIEVFGPESAGKTTIALHIVAEAQAVGKVAAFVDAEHALDPTYAHILGVNVDELLVSQPDSGEQALQIVDALVESRACDIIVVDSVAALVPEAELAGEIGDAHVGQQSRLMSQAMRILTGKCSRNKVAIIFINQIREKIGVMYGNPETTTGGRALKFYASLRLDVRRKEAIKVKDEVIGHEIRIKAVKNKVGVPFREVIVTLNYTEGIDKVADTIEYAIRRKLFDMNSSWYWLNGERLANGAAALKQYLKTNPEALAKVLDGVKKIIAADAEAARSEANAPAI